MLVDGDVGRVAAGDRADQAVVGRHHPALDRHRQGHSLLADQLEYAGQRFGAGLARQCVFHLVEADRPEVGEAAVGNVYLLGLAHEPGREPGGPRDHPRQPSGRPQGQVAEAVLDHDVAEEAVEPAAWRGRPLGPVAADGQRGIGVREDEELEVVVGRGERVEIGQYLVQRHRDIGPVQVEGRNRLQGHRADHAERADRNPRRAQQVGLVVPGQVMELAVRGDQVDRGHLGRQVRLGRAGAVGSGRDRPGDRLPVDVAEIGHRQPEAVELPVQSGQHGAAGDLDQTAREVGLDHPGKLRDVDHQVLAQRGGGERVAGTRHSDLAARRGGRCHLLPQLGQSVRPQDLARNAALVAGPVDPAATTSVLSRESHRDN